MNVEELSDSRETKELFKLMHSSEFGDFMRMFNGPVGKHVHYTFLNSKTDKENKYREGWAKITVPEGIDEDTYIGEFTDSLFRGGYEVIGFAEKSRAYYLFFTKNRINPVGEAQNA